MTLDDDLRDAFESSPFGGARSRRRICVVAAIAVAGAVLIVGIAAVVANDTDSRVAVTSASSAVARGVLFTTTSATVGTSTTVPQVGASDPSAAAGPVVATSTAPPAVEPSPSLTVTPNQGLPERRYVTVAGIGFPPDAQVSVLQCPASDEPRIGDCDTAWWSQSDGTYWTDAVGTLTADLRPVRRVLDNGTDCSTTAGRCELVVGVLGVAVVARAPLSFAGPSGPERPMTLHVEPATDLRDGQQVRVTASDLMPSDENLYECVGNVCGPVSQSVTIAADGTLDVTFTVRRTFSHENRSYDCAVDLCTIGTLQVHFVPVPISFARPGPTNTS